MRDLDSLRSTLEQHATGVVDHDLGARAGSVHDRVRVVRRRRRAAGAVTAAAALAVVVGVALLPGSEPGQDPTPASVAGVPVPTTLTSLGYRYTLSSSTDGVGSVSVDLEPSDRPRLVSWATSGPDDRVDVTDGSGSTTAYDVPDFSDFVLVGSGGAPTISVAAGTGEGVGLAVYDLVGDGTTFRQTVAGQELIGSTLGAPGESEARVEATAPGDGISYRAFCVDAPPRAVLHIETAAGEVISGGCDETLPFDPAASSGYSTSTSPGEDVSAGVRVTEGTDGPTLRSDSVVVGLAVYDHPSSRRSAAGSDVPDLVEDRGHLYRFDRLVTAEPGERRLAYGMQVLGRPVLAMGYADAGEATVVFGTAEGGETTRADGIPVGNAVIGLLSGEAVATVRVVGDAPDDVRLAIALYRLADQDPVD